MNRSGNGRRRSERRSSSAPAAREQIYPRPQFRREGHWESLDGAWEFHVDPDARLTRPDAVAWDASIRVPFAPETLASGVGETGLFKACWYRRTMQAPPLAEGQRLLLHFGAVDYEASVWLNDQLATQHEGGYTPFSADITDLLVEGGPQLLVVRARDDPADLAKPRGKQDWKPRPHSIWYMRTSGIWQTVWLEVVPAVRIASLRWTPDVPRWEIGIAACIAAPGAERLSLRVVLRHGDRLFSDDVYAVEAGEVSRRIGFPDPGIDDARNELLWHPDSPNLIDVEVTLQDAAGHVVDRVSSYTAMRSVALQRDRFALNGKPLGLRLVLDQGYWEESGLTAPNDDAFRRDVELVKQMGFNGVRMHQKIESPRFLYWADRLGLLVWEEMPSCYRFSKQTVERLTRQWTEAILRDVSHPCIVAWVPINESWGVPDLPEVPAERHCVQALYHLTKALDPTRAVIGNDGWEAVATDIIAIHDYDYDPARIARRYGVSGDAIEEMLREERPGFKMLLLDDFVYRRQPIMLTEFGGIAYSRDSGRTWGYSRAGSAAELARRYFDLLSVVRSLPLMSGFCYTQFTDTYQEANGLLYMDRTPKFPLAQIAIATRGAQSEADRAIEAELRQPVQEPDRASATRTPARKSGRRSSASR